MPSASLELPQPWLRSVTIFLGRQGEQLHRPGGGAVPLTDARKPRRFTASTICSTETCEGSNATAASFDRRLTSARLTPFSPSRAFLTATGQLPHVIPSTVRTTVEVSASAA